jgi:hypothetical protein
VGKGIVVPSKDLGVVHQPCTKALHLLTGRDCTEGNLSKTLARAQGSPQGYKTVRSVCNEALTSACLQLHRKSEAVPAGRYATLQNLMWLASLICLLLTGEATRYGENV